jgi:H/ACA ribonucleoprotein complex subunit 4
MRIHCDIKEKKLKEEMKKFVGKIKQLPPVKSRVKRTERERQVYSWNVLEKRGKEVLFETKVEAGTYIRKLIHDLGLKIGGAHMTELRRIKAGIFDESDSITLYDLEKISNSEPRLKQIIIPAEIISEILPVIEIKEDNLKQILTGKPIHKQDLKKKSELGVGAEVAVFCGERFVEVAKIVNQGDVIAKPQFVLN